MVKVAINGFGRIGRGFFRHAQNDKNIEVVAVNDLTDNATLAHLLKYDSAYGIFDGEVSATENDLVVKGKKIQALSEKDPTKLPWKDLDVDVVVESTGVFRTSELAGQHLTAGAPNVVLSAPAKGDNVNMFVIGANEKDFDKEKDKISSMASCTTNCVTPMAKILNDNFGIEEGLMTTIHAYTNGQRILDLPHNDLRRARAAAVNMIPTTTGAAVATTKVLPELKGKLNGMAVRVPVQVGSITDLTCKLSKTATAEEINSAFEKASTSTHKCLLQYNTDPIVLTDIVGNPHPCIFDAPLTMTLPNGLVKVLGWYDNEYGYSHQLKEFVKIVGKA